MQSLFSVHKGPDVKVRLKTVDNAANASSLGGQLVPPRLCGICHQAPSAYICPQCNIPYCNLKCYRGKDHLVCTEKFYKRQICRNLEEIPKQDDSVFLASLRQKVHVDEGIKTNDSLGEEHSSHHKEKQGLEEGAAIDPHHTEEDVIDDSIDCNHLDELSQFENITLEDLSDAEKRHFFNSIHSGIFTKNIEVWKSWWEIPTSVSSGDKIHILETTDNTVASSPSLEATTSHSTDQEGDEVMNAGKDKYESLLKSVEALPDFSTISQRPPSPMMKYLLVDVLFSYCHMIRLFNGDYHVDIIDASHVLVASSMVLTCDAKQENMSEVVNGCSCQVRLIEKQLPMKMFSERVLSTFKDVCSILQQRKHILCALADSRNLLQLLLSPNNQPRNISAIPAKSSKSRSESESQREKKHSEKQYSKTRKVIPSSSSSSKKEMKHQLNLLTRKLWYFMLWANGVGEHHFKSAHDELIKACEEYSTAVVQ